MHLTRRFFLQSSGAIAVYMGVAPHAALAHLGGLPGAQPVAAGKTLVVIFLRGGADGLNLVVPFGDPAYRKLRPTIAIGSPGSVEQSAIDLDGYFGLHPRLSALKPLFDEKLAVAAHAVGYDRNTRSHFEEQDVWETGIIGNTVNSDGWVNRHLITSEGRGPIRAVAVGDALPRILHGKAPAYAIRGVEDLTMPRSSGADPDAIAAALEHAYCTDPGKHHDPARDLLRQTADVTLDGIKQLRGIAGTEYKPNAQYPDTELARRLMQVARLIKADVGLEVAEVDYGGWDTHQDQGYGPFGQFAELTGQLGSALAAFSRDLGDRMQDTLVMTMTDFGRTAAENGTRGTDHGWANCMFMVGGAVAKARTSEDAAGPVVSQWPGLSKEQLHERRDLLHTTDFRDVLAEVVKVHLGNGNLEKVLPGHEFKPVGLVA